MQEMTYGWPTEMIVKAARAGVRIAEVPVSYRSRRAGKSKVGGPCVALFWLLGLFWALPCAMRGAEGRKPNGNC